MENRFKPGDIVQHFKRGMLSDEDLQTAIKLAADNEDYILASKLRDELKGRKEGN